MKDFEDVRGGTTEFYFIYLALKVLLSHGVEIFRMQLVLRRGNCPEEINLEVSVVQEFIKAVGVEKI